MRFGLWLSSGNPWEHVLRHARLAEALGWHGLWVPDHFMPPPDGYGRDTGTADPELGPVHEAWTLLAALAARVPRVRLGAMVTGNTYRSPPVLAKMAATVDHVSGGRLVVGLGAGWQENEHRRYGIEYGTVADRADRLDEAAVMLRSLFDAERTDHDGRHYRLEGAPLEPKPVQARLPLLIGGTGRRRTLPLVGRVADEWNGWVTPGAMVELGRIIDDHAVAAGRDPASIARSAAVLVFVCADEAEAARIRAVPSDRPRLIGTPEQLVEEVAAYAEAGADELVIPDFNWSADRTAELVEALAATVVAQWG